MIQINTICTVLTDIQNASDGTGIVGSDSGIQISPGAAGEAVGIIGRIFAVVDQLAAEFQNTALRIHYNIDGRFVDIDGCSIRIQCSGKGKVPGQIQPGVSNRCDIPALDADMGLQEVNAGGDACSFDLAQYGFQIFRAVGIGISVVVVAAQGIRLCFLEHGSVIDQHQPETAGLCEADVLVHSQWGNILCPIYRRIHNGISAALHAPRKIKIFLHRSDAVHKGFGAADDQRGGAALEANALDAIGSENPAILAVFGVDTGVRGSGEDIDADFVVPAHIQPFSELLAVTDGQLHKTEFHGRGRCHLQRVAFGINDKICQCKGNVIGCFPQLHHSLIGNDLEAHDQAVTLSAKAVGLECGALIAVHQLHFIVKGSGLGDGKQSDILILHQALFSACFVDQAFYDAVTANSQPQVCIFDNDIHKNSPYSFA